MNFILKPSLEHIALVKVSAVLWNQPDIRALMVKFSNFPLFPHVDDEHCFMPDSERKIIWQKIEDKVTEKMTQLTIPISLKDKMLGYIQSVGLQILRWMEVHHRKRKCCVNLDLPNEFCWTSQGIIDKKKTAEMFIRDHSIDVTTRYKLACIYCLEDDILELWNELSENDRKYFYNEHDPSKVPQQHLVVLWTYIIKGKTAKICNMARRIWNIGYSFYSFAMQCAISSGSKAAVEYFLQKLNWRNNSLLEMASTAAQERSDMETADTPNEYTSEILLFLLSQMSSEQQIELFKDYSFPVLLSLLDWPGENSFVETTSHALKCLPENFYVALMRASVFKKKFGNKDHNYQKMFEEVWQQIPSIHKSHFINDPHIEGLVLLLLKTKHIESIKLIFQDASFTERNKLIFSYAGYRICVHMFNYIQLSLFMFVAPLCVSSRNEMIKFHEEFKKHIQTNDKQYAERDPVFIHRLYLFCMVLGDMIRWYDKRKCADEADNSSSKKLCSDEFKRITRSSVNK